MKPTIQDITDPAEFLPAPTPLWQTWWFLLAVTIGVLLLLALLYFTFRKKAETKRRTTLLEKAQQRLDTLKSEAEKLTPQTTAVRISIIIRQYLEAAIGDPALFETNEEFTLRPSALSKLHPDSRQPVTEHLTALSELKYAPSVEPQQLTDLIDEASAVLANIEINVSPAKPPPLPSPERPTPPPLPPHLPKTLSN